MPACDLLDAEKLNPELVQALTDAQLPGVFKGPALDGSGVGGVRDNDEIAAAADICARIARLIRHQYLGTLQEAGLWLAVDELDRSHAISQNVKTAEGSFWHGLMHRREGDYSNAKYWFRRVGSHDAYHRLADVIQQNASKLHAELPIKRLTDPRQLAETLVDQCHTAIRKTYLTRSLQQIAWWEWQLLFTHCL